MQKWVSSSDCELCCDPSDCSHESMSPASSTLYLLPVLLHFVLLLPFHDGVLHPIILSVLALPLLGLTTPLPVFAFALTVSPTVPIARACVSSFACIFACQILPCPTICSAVVLFVMQAISGTVITFTTVPAWSLLSFALAFALTFPELLDHGEYLILGDLIYHLLVFPLFSFDLRCSESEPCSHWHFVIPVVDDSCTQVRMEVARSSSEYACFSEQCFWHGSTSVPRSSRPHQPSWHIGVFNFCHLLFPRLHVVSGTLQHLKS